MGKTLTQKEMMEMTEGKEPEVIFDLHFIEELGGTVVIARTKKGFIQDARYEQFVQKVAIEIGNIMNLAILDAKGLLPRKEDIGRA